MDDRRYFYFILFFYFSIKIFVFDEILLPFYARGLMLLFRNVLCTARSFVLMGMPDHASGNLFLDRLMAVESYFINITVRRVIVTMNRIMNN